MRKVLYVVMALAAIYAGYWAVGSRAVENGLKRWFAERQDEGWVAEYSTLQTRGFPSRFDTTITGLELADPATGLAWSAPFVQFLALSYQPQHYIAVWPETQVISTPYEKISVNSAKMQASVVFVPGPSFTLDHSTFILDQFDLKSSANWAYSVETGRFATRRTAGATNSHDIGFEALNVMPDVSVLSVLDPGKLLPDQIDALKVDAIVGFDAPWDRYAIEDRRPQPTAISLNLLQATWGQLELRMAGDLTITDGVPDGRITIRAQNWREMIAIGVNAGLIPAAIAPTIERAAELLAGMSGNPKTLDAPLSFQKGFMSFGPIPLGPAPRIVLR